MLSDRKLSVLFITLVYCGQTVGWIKIPLGTEVGLGPGDFVLDGDSAPAEKWAQPPPPNFGHVYCGQTAGWMKTPLGTEVDLCLGHTVLDGVPATRERGT